MKASFKDIPNTDIRENEWLWGLRARAEGPAEPYLYNLRAWARVGADMWAWARLSIISQSTSIQRYLRLDYVTSRLKPGL